MPTLGWYAQRLKAMSVREMMFRLQRTAATNVQRIASRTPAPAAATGALAIPALPVPDVDPEPYLERADRLLQGRIDVFARREFFLGNPPEWLRDPSTGRKAPLVFGKSIDYRDEKIVGNIKYLWEPSRHLMLPALAQAWRLSGERKYLRGIVEAVDSWLEQSPYPNGVHWCSSLEVAIRLINWSVTWRIAGSVDCWRSADDDDGFFNRWLSSIYQHMKFIDGYYSAFSSANNHLIGEAAGVYVGASTWPAWSECRQWRQDAKAILVREIGAQTHPDGVNAEQAMAYQQFVLDFFIVSGLTGSQVDDAFPAQYWDWVTKMLQFVASMMDVAGNLPMIGDADDGYVLDLAPEPGFNNYRSLLCTGAILLDRSDFAAKAAAVDSKTGWLLKEASGRFDQLAMGESSFRGRQKFPSGGYYVLGSDLESQDEIRIIFDAGPLGMGSLAAHGHADALSVWLSVCGTPILIDPGTYAYHTDKLWRDYFRGTSAHNTVRVDGIDQSVIGGNFLWTRHANATVEMSRLEGNDQVVAAFHDGYMRLDDPVKHHRTLRFDVERRTIWIEDVLECEGEHEAEIYFHFPEYAACEQQDDAVVVHARDHVLRICPEHELRGEIFHGNDQLPLGWISYHFDVKLPSYSLRYAGTVKGSTKLVTEIQVIR